MSTKNRIPQNYNSNQKTERPASPLPKIGDVFFLGDDIQLVVTSIGLPPEEPEE